MDKIIRRVRSQIVMTPLRRFVVGWRHRNLRADDILLASYPKSGNTWMKHLLVYLLTDAEHGFHGNDDPMIPSIGSDTRTSLRCGAARILKTHEPFRNSYRKAIYLVRDGRDVVISNYWYQQRQLRTQLDFETFFTDFLKGHADQYGSWHEHVRSWVSGGRNNDTELLIVRYEDLLSDGVRELTNVCQFLSLDVPHNTLERAVEANSFSAMKKREQATQRTKDIEEETGIAFVRKGTAGQWREHFSSEQLKRFEQVAGDVLQDLGYETF